MSNVTVPENGAEATVHATVTTTAASSGPSAVAKTEVWSAEGVTVTEVGSDEVAVSEAASMASGTGLPAESAKLMAMVEFWLSCRPNVLLIVYFPLVFEGLRPCVLGFHLMLLPLRLG